MNQPLLNGEVEFVDPAEERSLARISELEDRVSALESRLTQVRREAVIALLNMLSESMRHIAQGKMDIPDTVVTSGTDTRWEAIKSRLGPRLREAIDVLAVQGPMKRTQLASAMRMDYSNCVKNVVGVLKSQGLLAEANGELSLKQL